MNYYKITDRRGRACHGGTFQYSFPKHGKPGKWTPRIDVPSLCCRGYHVTDAMSVQDWHGFDLSTHRVWIVEVRDPTPDDGFNKYVCSQIRLLREVDPTEIRRSSAIAMECTEAETARAQRDKALVVINRDESRLVGQCDASKAKARKAYDQAVRAAEVVRDKIINANNARIRVICRRAAKARNRAAQTCQDARQKLHEFLCANQDHLVKPVRKTKRSKKS